jgi:HlyD family secretion protein
MQWWKITVLLFFALAACLGRGDSDIPTAAVEEGEFVVDLAILGEFKAVRNLTISVPDLDVQAKVLFVAEEGSRVSKEDLLIQFDITELETELERVLTEEEVSKTKIEQKRAQLDVRLSDLNNNITRSELELQRAKMRLTESETVPRVEREGAKIDVEGHGLTVKSSEASMESARLEGEAELQLLRLEAEQASARVEKVRRQIESTSIYAQSDGLVILPEIWKGGTHGPVQAGDTLWGGRTVMELPDLSEMEVEAWVHEIDASKVAESQVVEVVIDAYPDPPHRGTIRRVADLAVKRNRNAIVKHVKVIIALDESTSNMKPGMTVRADVLVESVPKATFVPQEAIFHEGALSFVYRSGLTGWKRTDVEIGTTNDTHVIVESGLSGGDIVALVDPSAHQTGQLPKASTIDAPPTRADQ